MPCHVFQPSPGDCHQIPRDLVHPCLASAPPAARAPMWPRPRPAGAYADLVKTSGINTCSEETREPETSQKMALPKIPGGAEKNLTFVTIPSEMAGEPLFMRVSEHSQNLTFF